MIDTCVKCGYCCKKGLCSYGRYSPGKKDCLFLEEDNEELGTFICSIRDKIKEEEQDCSYSMFDCGCSSSFLNTVRNAVVEKMK